jgi:hypothetical protein
MFEWRGANRRPHGKEATWTKRFEQTGEPSTMVESLVAPPDHPFWAVVYVEQDGIPEAAAIEQTCDVANIEPHARVEERVTGEMPEAPSVPCHDCGEKLGDHYLRVTGKSVEECAQCEAQSESSNENPRPPYPA